MQIKEVFELRNMIASAIIDNIPNITKFEKEEDQAVCVYEIIEDILKDLEKNFTIYKNVNTIVIPKIENRINTERLKSLIDN